MKADEYRAALKVLGYTQQAWATHTEQARLTVGRRVRGESKVLRLEELLLHERLAAIGKTVEDLAIMARTSTSF